MSQMTTLKTRFNDLGTAFDALLKRHDAAVAERDRLKESHAELLEAATYAADEIRRMYDTAHQRQEITLGQFRGLTTLRAAIEKAGKL